MIHLTINDRAYTVAEGRTLLEACREQGIPIPTLCYHPALSPYGACRLCMVEVSQPPRKARLVAACTYPCEEGLTVKTETQAVRRSRRLTVELLLAEAFDVPEIQALAQEIGGVELAQVRYRLPEESACVLCGLCVRACQEIVGVSAISLVRRGIAKQVSPPFEVASATCIGCGTCVLICPTGALQLSAINAYDSTHSSTSDFQTLECQVCGQAPGYQVV